MRSTNYQSGNSNNQRTVQAQSSASGYSYQTNTRTSGGADFNAEKDFFLKYASLGGDSTVISGSSDYGLLLGLRDAILQLRSDFFNQSGSILIKTEERPELDKRFLHFEHELEGLLRRRIEYFTKDYEGGTRNLDFTNLLNEKENQIIELEKKIQNYEERLRRASARELEL